jgi:O-antigen ligase
LGVAVVTEAEALLGEVPSYSARGVLNHDTIVRHGGPGSRRVLRILLVGLPLVLAGYALDDRGFAYLASVPGTPLFAAEMLLLLGAAFAALATGYLRVALRHSVPFALLIVFMALGLARTLPLISSYGLDSIRDAALWYYSLMAVLVATLVVAVPDLPRRWARAYAPFLVVLLLWSPIALFLANLSGPVIPGSGVPFFSHKPGNIAVAAVTAIAFLWLVPTHSMSRRTRALLTGLATVIILAVGTQNRGGLVAAAAAILVTVVLLGRQRWNMAGVMVGTVLVGFVLGWGFNVVVPGGQGRDYSVAQLVENAASISGGSQADTQLNSTVQFRTDLWSGAINLAYDQNALLAGLGFGPNLAQELGVSTGVSDPLRSPHNSHVDILARMGLVGAFLWVAFWVSWYLVMFRRARDASNRLSPEGRGLIKVCMVGVTAILVNAYFDPTLESPQVSIWLWALVGLGLGIAAKSIAANKNTTIVTHR